MNKTFHLSVTTMGVLGVFALSGISPAAAATYTVPNGNSKPRVVNPEIFGQHIHNLALLPTLAAEQKTFPAIRLWDNGVRWDEINTAPSVYNWEKLDAAVAAAEQHGAKRIMYVLGSTPGWAATGTTIPNYLKSPGANYPAKNIQDWEAWVSAVTSRYGNRITDYQVWNEANFSSFWTGTPKTMWQYTDVVSRHVRANAPQSKIVTPSLIVRQKSGTKQSVSGKKSFTAKYLKLVASKKTPVDKIGVHLYPWASAGPGDGTPQDRYKSASMFIKEVRKAGLKQPIVDTEMGYGNRRDNGWRKTVVPDKVAAGYVTQTYLQSLLLPISETYWYGWDDHVLGVDLTNPSTGQATFAGEQYFTAKKLLEGSTVSKCFAATTKVPFNSCRITLSQTGRAGYLLWSNKKPVKVKKPSGVTTVVGMSGYEFPLSGRKTVRVSTQPIVVVK